MGRSLFDVFPHVAIDELTIRKIVPSDLDSLYEIYSNERLFLHSPVMLKKNKTTLANMIGYFERDFNKRKMVFLGISLNSDPGNIVGMLELFDYDTHVNMVTIGYRLNDRFWGRGIATKAVQAMTDYLMSELDINRIQAFVMPENVRSQDVLLRNGFTREGLIRQGHVWKGHGVVDLLLFSRL